MKKLYNEFFYVPECGKGKIREKVMLMRTAVTVAIMLVCLMAMGITAYAYFAYNVTSASNVIKTANFEVDVVIQTGDSEKETVIIEQLDNKTKIAALEAGKVYTVTLTNVGTAKTGFCVISATGCDIKEYHTQQIGKDVNAAEDEGNPITFQVTVTDETVMTFYSHWGTSSYYEEYVNKGEEGAFYIINGEVLNLQINGITASVIEESAEITDEKEILDETVPAEEVHVFSEGEILSEIAEKYGTSVDRIISYNNLVNPDDIQVGQELKIPPADWIMPEIYDDQMVTPPTTETTPPEEITPPVTEMTPPEEIISQETTVNDLSDEIEAEIPPVEEPTEEVTE